MSSAAEAELGALYINAKEAVHIRQMLREMGHPQPRTPIQTDNSTAEGVINSKIQPKRTKAMDMRYFCLKDREAQDQFRFFWRAGATNLADYWTKHHPGAHHRNMRKEFLTTMHELTKLREEIRGRPAARVCWTDRTRESSPPKIQPSLSGHRPRILIEHSDLHRHKMCHQPPSSNAVWCRHGRA